VSTILIEQHKGLPLTVNQWHPGSISAARAYTVEVPVQELGPADFQTFLNNFRGKLIHAVIHGMVKDMLNRTTLVVRSTMLANVLDAPVTELAMRKEINLCQNFFNRRSLLQVLAPSSDLISKVGL
jgi:hypothetical protein